MELSPRRFADTVVLGPAGRIDHATAEAFQGALATHLGRCADGQDRIVLDLSGVEYIASVGLRVLMLAAKQAKAHGGTFVVAGMQPVVREILEISRFTMILRTFASVREALAQISPSALAAFAATG
jgi:anti-anti-sigma factor